LSTSTQPIPDVDSGLLAEVVETLAAIDRPSCSDGERQAAEWLAERFESLGCPARVEAEASHDSYWWTISAASAVGVLGASAALRGRRFLGLLAGLASAAGIADEISNGPRPLRRMLLSEKTAWNVAAEAGDPEAERTIVLLAHHDAPHTGLVFHPAPQKALGNAFPEIVENTDTAIPLWWPTFGGAVLTAVGSLLGRRWMLRLGRLLGLASVGMLMDIARSPAVPGANDNLSGVAVLVAIAEQLRRRPVEGLRVILASCGSEESLQGGIRPFMERHAAELPVATTSFLNFDTVGSPRLVLLEGEGPLVMEDYPGTLRDTVAECAEGAGIKLRRGQRARSSTDSVIPGRYGYPTATLTSFDKNKSLSNYHWPTDVPGNLDYGIVADAAALGELVIRRLADA
jgi:hypothetical protein